MVVTIRSSDRPAFTSLMMESLLSACWATSRGQNARNTTVKKHLRMCSLLKIQNRKIRQRTTLKSSALTLHFSRSFFEHRTSHIVCAPPLRQKEVARMGQGTLLLPANDQHNKAAGEHRWAGARISGCGFGTRAKLGGDQVDAVSGGVVGHRPCAALGGQALNGGIAWSAGIDHGENSLTTSGESQLVGGIPIGAIRTIADHGNSERLAGLRVGHSHLLAVAGREEPVADRIKGQAAGAVAAGNRPLSRDLVGFGVKADQLVLVFNVDKDRDFAIYGGKLRLAGEGDSGDYLAPSSGDSGR